MDFYILTLFPEMVMNGLSASITGRAMENGAISAEAIDIRDYSHDKHHHVDDGPYGGGAGLVMQPGPVVEAYEALCERLGKKPRLIYMTPQGRVFDQELAKELAKEPELVFLCGHYEGVDERALELICTDQISIGDYVLTGGELPAMVAIDCISRLVPGVLHNEDSAEEESFQDNLLEYPQYTRPEVFRDMQVPPILLSGHHQKIHQWRRQQSIIRTLERRPDLLETAQLTKKEREFLEELLKERSGNAAADTSEMYNEEADAPELHGQGADRSELHGESADKREPNSAETYASGPDGAGICASGPSTVDPAISAALPDTDGSVSA